MSVKRLGTMVLLGLSMAPSSLAIELPAWLTERRIIGTNDLEPVEETRETADYDKAQIVGRVEEVDGAGFCTSSRVGDDLFLTNFHCFEFKPCEYLQVHLGYEKAVPRSEQMIYRCKEVLAQNLNLDYVLYRVKLVGPPPEVTVRTYDFADLNMPVPDNDQNGVSQNFSISQAGNIIDLKVKVRITHPWIGDLRISLVGPDGTSVVLHDNVGGDGLNMDRIYSFNDGLKIFAGKPASGEWRLDIQDLAAGDAGQLDFVAFEVTTPLAEERSLAASDDDGVWTRIDQGYPKATLWAGNISVDQPLLVASHPRARLKEVDRSEGCKLRTIDPEIKLERQTITHTCDTEGGSSGSPVLDRETGYVVGLHWGGNSEFNYAIPMSLIVADMEEKLRTDDFAKLTVAR